MDGESNKDNMVNVFKNSEVELDYSLKDFTCIGLHFTVNCKQL